MRRLQTLTATSWPLFTAFRVKVRASWTIVVLPAFFAWSFAKWLPIWEALGWGAAWTIANPGRGPHDRIAGTWVVAR